MQSQKQKQAALHSHKQTYDQTFEAGLMKCCNVRLQHL